MKITVIYFCEALFLLSVTAIVATDKTYWYNRNHEVIKQRISFFNLKAENLVRVKNVILFVGDGMGLTTITASRVLKRQSLKNPEAQLVFDEFPASAFIQTDTSNSQISESAAAATALFCGVKTNFESLGVDASGGKDACSKIESHTSSIISWAQEQSIKTGFVTTARVIHATPAALYSHSRRHMEDDYKLTDDNCKDIARQMIENEPGRSLNVIMGGGLRSFLPQSDPPGRRQDERNLTHEWLSLHQNGELVLDRTQMLSVNEDTEYLFGIFAPSHMHFNADRNPEIEPSLAEMTSTAIKILRRNNKNGFFLAVEGGKIDLAHHYNNAFRALDDTLAFEHAIEVAYKSVDLRESLIIVTADHASAMVYSGFATPKDYSILGMDKFVSNINKRPYQLLTYSSGLGFEYFNESSAINDHRNSYHKASIPSTWANHAGDDVPLYAVGSLANILFSGTLDQTYIPHAIAFAMCLFDYQDRCLKYEQKSPSSEPTRFKKPNALQMLKRKLQNEIFREQTEVNSKSNGSEPTVTETFVNESDNVNENSTDVDELLLLSELLGNSTEEQTSESSSSNITSVSFNLICFIVITVSISRQNPYLERVLI